MSQYDNPVKNRIRRLAVDEVNTHAALMLPNTHALCVKELIQRGSVDRVVCVDRSIDVLREAKSHLHKLTESFDIHTNYLARELHDLTEFPTKFGFAFLDLCGPINDKLGFWFADYLSESLTDKAELSLTIQRTYRNCAFMHVFSSLLQDDEFDSLLLHSQKLLNQATGEIGEYSYSDHNQEVYFEDNPCIGYRNITESVLKQMALIQLLFPAKQLTVKHGVTYRGNNNSGALFIMLRLGVESKVQKQTAYWLSLQHKLWQAWDTYRSTREVTTVNEVLKAYNDADEDLFKILWSRIGSGKRAAVSAKINQKLLKQAATKSKSKTK